MKRYIATAAALRFFSATALTKRVYRSVGNRVGPARRIRMGLPEQYVDRSIRALGRMREWGILEDGRRCLEIGTGWVHWDATFLSLFHDIEVTLLDVWDNRQFEPIAFNLRALSEVIDDRLDLDEGTSEKVHGLIDRIVATRSFGEMYDLLGFEYVVEPSGELARFADASFDVVWSFNTLEHVKRDVLPSFTRDIHRILRPGGWTVHQIDIGDHLAYYDPGVSRKNYLRYSDDAWRLLFENNVQYFNRVQRSDWLRYFEESGLELVEETCTGESVDSLRISRSFEGYPREDLECTTMFAIFRRPGHASIP